MANAPVPAIDNFQCGGKEADLFECKQHALSEKKPLCDLHASQGIACEGGAGPLPAAANCAATVRPLLLRAQPAASAAREVAARSAAVGVALACAGLLAVVALAAVVRQTASQPPRELSGRPGVFEMI